MSSSSSLNIAAIIPARGASKRLAHKNIYPVRGKPMMQYSIEACKNSRYNVMVWVSSDDTQILELASQLYAGTILRPVRLAGGHVLKMAAIRHAAAVIEGTQQTTPDICISLQANNPEITADHIDRGISKLLNNSALDEVFSVDLKSNQNGVFRIMKWHQVFQEDLSTNCGVVVCDVVDVHTLDDVRVVEGKLK